MGDRSTALEHLSDLASDIETELHFRTTMTSSLSDPFLTVRNPAVPQLNERIQVSGGLFLWSWGQVICPVHERATALRLIRRVLSGASR